MIETENLKLIPCEPSHLATVLEDKKGLEPLLGVSVPEGETLSDGHGSIRVLEKLGMKPAGATDSVLRWRLEREDLGEGGRR